MTGETKTHRLRDQSAIIPIGPIGAGKSTIGRLLSETLVMPRLEMDELRWGYYKEIGYSDEEAGRRHREGGIDALLR